MEWEEYFSLVFKFGNKVQAPNGQSPWERVLECFDCWNMRIEPAEARSLLRDSGRK